MLTSLIDISVFGVINKFFYFNESYVQWYIVHIGSENVNRLKF